MLCSYRLEVPPNPEAVLVPLEEPLDELRFRFRTGDGLNYEISIRIYSFPSLHMKHII